MPLNLTPLSRNDDPNRVVTTTRPPTTLNLALEQNEELMILINAYNALINQYQDGLKINHSLANVGLGHLSAVPNTAIMKILYLYRCIDTFNEMQPSANDKKVKALCTQTRVTVKKRVSRKRAK